MKLVLSLLETFLELKPGTTPHHIEKALIQLGHEVEGITTSGGNFPHVVVGKILEREQHPNADRLGVCQVDVGEGSPRQIVCGAPNARAGLTVAVALPGAVLPGDFKIGESAIRGIESKGMICSERELGLSDEHKGIWEMQTDATPGTPLNTVMGPAETVMEVSITPNRGDCFSHLGLARDLAALNIGTLKPVSFPAAGKAKPAITGTTTTPDCPALNLLEITGTANKPSPRSVQKQLEAAGLRPRGVLVDATNYTMIALGQPLHAYDAAKLKGSITVAAAKGGETYKGLNDVALTLQPGDITINDGTGIIGLGGILGGEESAVSETTTAVVLEAAYFNPVRIALTGQAHQLFTDARQRFERGVDPAMTQQALLFCAQCITEWAGGELSAMVTAGQGVEAPKPIAYNPQFFTQLIGMEVEPARQKEILESLGFRVESSPEFRIPNSEFRVTPPTYRTYMTTPEDLTEEVLRIIGYENVPPTLPPAMPGQFQVDSRPIELDRTARKALAAAGFPEIITYSFIGTPEAEKFAEGQALISLANPLAQTDMTTLRPSLLPGLLNALKGNFARTEPSARLAEVGKIYTAKGESLSAAGVLTTVGARHWHMAERTPDVFSAKAAAQHVLQTLGAPVESGTVASKAPGYYHPGRSGTLAVGPFTLATFGELHPAIAKHYGLGHVAAFELNLDALLKLTSKPRPWQTQPYPPVLRDLAFLLPKSVKAAELVATIRATNRDILKSVEIFDHYQGERIPADKQSLAVSLTLQSAEKTLADADIKPVLEAAVEAVKTQLHGELRA